MAVEGREYTYIHVSACRQATAGNMLRGRACQALSCTHLWSRISHRRILRDCAGKRISSCPCLLMLSQWCYRTRDAPHALMYTMRQALYHRGVVALFPCSGNTFRGSWPSLANALDSSNDTSTDLTGAKQQMSSSDISRASEGSVCLLTWDFLEVIEFSWLPLPERVRASSSQSRQGEQRAYPHLLSSSSVLSPEAPSSLRNCVSRPLTGVRRKVVVFLVVAFPWSRPSSHPFSSSSLF